MITRLDAWLEGRHVGQFVFDDGAVRFEYDPDAPETPISLSLPRRGKATRHAAENFLENLLPDHAVTRARMARVYGARSPDAADLLEQAGGDIAGGLVILPEGQEPPGHGSGVLNPALDRDIADRINSIKLDPDAWAPLDVPARFSLAGTQGKFAIARIDDEWYWSNAAIPSTHVVKPGRPSLRNIEAAEAAALTLAALSGIPSAGATILHADDQTAFITERFDRDTGEAFPRRLHAEDLAQALGVSPDAKYDVTAKRAVQALAPVDTEGSLVRGFLSQLVFNTLIGNADAHAKNYSVLLRPSGVSLAPLYDVVPVGLYPEFDQELAMRIGGAAHPQAVTSTHWRQLARTIGFDEDEMSLLVARVADHVADANDTAWSALDDDQSARQREIVERNIDAARP